MSYTQAELDAHVAAIKAEFDAKIAELKAQIETKVDAKVSFIKAQFESATRPSLKDLLNKEISIRESSKTIKLSCSIQEPENIAKEVAKQVASQIACIKSEFNFQLLRKDAEIKMLHPSQIKWNTYLFD